jgi:rod shape-determining protein MreD
MHAVFFVFSLFSAAILQALTPSWSAVGQAKPPLLLAVAIYFALTRPARRALPAAAAAGLIQDALGLTPLGYSAAGFLVAAAAVNRYRDEMYPNHPVTHILTGAAAAAGVTAALAVALSAAGRLAFDAPWFAMKSFGSLVLGGLVTPVLCHLLQSLDEVLGLRPRKEEPAWP